MRFFTMFLIFLVTGCADLEPVEVEAYYDVDSLVNAQYEALKLSSYPIQKNSMVNGKTDSSYLEPGDSTRWLYELSVFKKAGINKPELRGAYTVEHEETTNGRSITYTPKEPEKRVVRYLKVEFDRDDLRSVQARIRESNPVYGSDRELAMYFQERGDKTMLHRYEVTGSQKMVLKDTVKLRVTSEILYDSK